LTGSGGLSLPAMRGYPAHDLPVGDPPIPQLGCSSAVPASASGDGAKVGTKSISSVRPKSDFSISHFVFLRRWVRVDGVVRFGHLQARYATIGPKPPGYKTQSFRTATGPCLAVRKGAQKILRFPASQKKRVLKWPKMACFCPQGPGKLPGRSRQAVWNLARGCGKGDQNI
jgi:hypothetical protein